MFVLLHYAKSFPPLVQVAIVAQKMLLDFPEDEMFLLDLWPSFHPTIMCANPEALLLTTQKWNWPKTPHLQNALTPITGGPSLLTQNGKDWKLWRSRFNPGFSERSLVDHVPFIVDRVQVFCDKLREKAGKELFSLDDFATRLTFEVVMKVSLLVLFRLTLNLKWECFELTIGTEMLTSTTNVRSTCSPLLSTPSQHGIPSGILGS
jgi:hypothetical protein